MVVYTPCNVCSVLLECYVLWRGILSTVGDVQYRGGYHEKCGGTEHAPRY